MAQFVVGKMDLHTKIRYAPYLLFLIVRLVNRGYLLLESVIRPLRSGQCVRAGLLAGHSHL